MEIIGILLDVLFNENFGTWRNRQGPGFTTCVRPETDFLLFSLYYEIIRRKEDGRMDQFRSRTISGQYLCFFCTALMLAAKSGEEEPEELYRGYVDGKDDKNGNG